MRSVWSRVGSGLDHAWSAPGVLSPASSTADLTWADGTGSRYSIGTGSAAPVTASGSRPPSRLTKLRPEMRQRLDDPAHRPAPQRGVAGDEGGERVGRQHAEQQPRRGAGIAEIEHVLGLAERRRPRRRRPASARPPSRSTPAPIARSAAAVASTSSPSSRPGDLGAADRQRAEHQRPVRDRFVAGHRDRAGERRLRAASRSARSGRRRGRCGIGHRIRLANAGACASCRSRRRRPICGLPNGAASAVDRCATLLLTGRDGCGNAAPCR